MFLYVLGRIIMIKFNELLKVWPLDHSIRVIENLLARLSYSVFSLLDKGFDTPNLKEKRYI